ncbi:MAG: hypothetical protein BJ554DRAFT_3703 [Olpidium bornovanus]|uniref:Uncharacterized protein n=1 Tax=Olpidium bornovanus TaxID=278681 RepID=A0A8H8A086_9FUNG|nr:MAG: hypothetical protein BJ554DRAFT_3703 [Olpidium bornovanus]
MTVSLPPGGGGGAVVDRVPASAFVTQRSTCCTGGHIPALKRQGLARCSF